MFPDVLIITHSFFTQVDRWTAIDPCRDKLART